MVLIDVIYLFDMYNYLRDIKIQQYCITIRLALIALMSLMVAWYSDDGRIFTFKCCVYVLTYMF